MKILFSPDAAINGMGNGTADVWATIKLCTRELAEHYRSI